MNVTDATSYFGCSDAELARKLRLKSPSAISNWKRIRRGLIPEVYARRLKDMTRGKLKFDPKAYE